MVRKVAVPSFLVAFAGAILTGMAVRGASAEFSGQCAVAADRFNADVQSWEHAENGGDGGVWECVYGQFASFHFSWTLGLAENAHAPCPETGYTCGA